MPIEFRCTSCGRLLRVTDEAAGQQAKCPECGKVMNVPTTSAPIAPGGAAAENPYQSPEYAGSAAAPPAEPTGEIFPALIDVGGVYSRT